MLTASQTQVAQTVSLRPGTPSQTSAATTAPRASSPATSPSAASLAPADSTAQLGSYDYDFEGRRLSKTVGSGSTSTTTSYVYSGINLVNEFGSAGQLVNSYDCGTDLVSAQLGGEGERLYFHDALGSTTALVAGTGSTSGSPGSVVARYEYDAWGRQISASQPSVNRQNFTTYQHDDETGLEYAQARYYDSSVGRFSSFDSITEAHNRFMDPQGLNFFGYVRSNPLAYSDPTGKEWRYSVDSSNQIHFRWLDPADVNDVPEPGWRQMYRGQDIGLVSNASGVAAGMNGYFATVRDPERNDPNEAFDITDANGNRVTLNGPDARGVVRRLDPTNPSPPTLPPLKGGKSLLERAWNAIPSDVKGDTIEFSGGVIKAAFAFAYPSPIVPEDLKPSIKDSYASLIGQLAFNLVAGAAAIFVARMGPRIGGAAGGMLFGFLGAAFGEVTGGPIAAVVDARLGAAIGTVLGAAGSMAAGALAIKALNNSLNIGHIILAKASTSSTPSNPASGSGGGGGSGESGGGSNGGGKPPRNAHLEDLPMPREEGKFYIRASELLNEENIEQTHPLNEKQMLGSEEAGHGGVRNLSNEDLLKPGGPQGDDPISGLRQFQPGDSSSFPGSRIVIRSGHHRLAEIARRVRLGQIDGNTLIELQVSKQ